MHEFAQDDHRMGGLLTVQASATRLLGLPPQTPLACTASNRLVSRLIAAVDRSLYQVRANSVIETAETWITLPGVQVLRNDHPLLYERRNPPGRDVLGHFVFVNEEHNEDDWEILTDFLGEEEVRNLYIIDLAQNVVAELDHMHYARVVYTMDDKIYFSFLGREITFAELLF